MKRVLVPIMPLLLAGTAAFATDVPSNKIAATSLGSIVAGQKYNVATTGVSNLYASFNGGLGLTFTPNGIPTYAFPSPYSAFYPNGLNNDPTSGTICLGGVSNLCGALIGAYVLNIGDTPFSYFTIGASYSFTAPISGYLVGVVNDIPNAYGDNASTGFSVTVTPAAVGAVPEPATWGLMILGFGVAGAALRRRTRAAITFA